MKLTKKKYHYAIEDFFSSLVRTGFTTKEISGKLPSDIPVLSFLKDKSRVVYLNQIHSEKIHFVQKPGVYEGDGLFTREKDLTLIVKTADCLPLVFCSEDMDIIGVVHMGWRSAKAGILDQIILLLNEWCNDLVSFKVIAGVAMRSCCYEVGEEFLNYEFLSQYVRKKNDRLYFDPVVFARQKLMAYGLKEENFLDMNICSFCHQEQFFSYRRTREEFRTLSFVFNET